MELTDGIVVHKNDGGNKPLVKKTVREYNRILHMLQPASPGWTSTAQAVSSIERTGLKEVWETILQFQQEMIDTDYWQTRRQLQTRDWFHSMIKDHLIDSFLRNKVGKLKLKGWKKNYWKVQSLYPVQSIDCFLLDYFLISSLICYD